MATIKSAPVHYDKLEQLITIGCHLVYASPASNLTLGKVVKMTPKMLLVCNVESKHKNNKYVYPLQTLVADDKLVLMHLMQH